jgi:hypothetical protein
VAKAGAKKAYKTAYDREYKLSQAPIKAARAGLKAANTSLKDYAVRKFQRGHRFKSLKQSREATKVFKQQYDRFFNSSHNAKAAAKRAEAYLKKRLKTH